jgi:hypothetical protein
MGALLASVCLTLVILAFCQIIIETILPEGGTKRYVMFIAGLVAVVVIVSTFTMSGWDVMKTIYEKTAELKDAADKGNTQQNQTAQSNPYKDYIERLIDTYK